MSEIEQKLRERHAELQRFANVVRSNRPSIDFAAQRSFLTQTIQVISR